ncbi:hypothetical protein ACTXT7_005410 [Hymenolepis weldensis]
MLFDNLLDGEDVKQYQDPQRAAIYIMEGLLSLDRRIGTPLGNAEIVDAAAYNLFLAYIHGWGVKMSDEKALQYLQIAAENGNTKVSVKAQTAMGLYYSSSGHFDLDRAFYWHSQACQNGSLESQAIIGVMHMYGLGPAGQDWSEALNCLRSASERGSIYATGMLSFLYFRRGFYTLASRTAYSLVANTEFQKSLTINILNGKSSTSRIPFGSMKDSCDLGGQIFMHRAVAVACFIYATCLERGLGVQKDSSVASAMYSKEAMLLHCQRNHHSSGDQHGLQVASSLIKDKGDGNPINQKVIPIVDIGFDLILLKETYKKQERITFRPEK